MQTTTYWRAILIALLGTTLLACATSEAPLHRAAESDLPKNIGIHGYSPVSYFAHNRAEKGNNEFGYDYKGKMYYFTSADQISEFKKNPDQYLPKYGEYCPYSLALGRRVGIDPTNFKIHNGELLLFHDRVELSTVDVDAQREIFEKADKEYTLLRF